MSMSKNSSSLKKEKADTIKNDVEVILPEELSTVLAMPTMPPLPATA
jgi:hypothetical protein